MFTIIASFKKQLVELRLTGKGAPVRRPSAIVDQSNLRATLANADGMGEGLEQGLRKIKQIGPALHQTKLVLVKGLDSVLLHRGIVLLHIDLHGTSPLLRIGHDHQSVGLPSLKENRAPVYMQ
jgi:hypothetical protein